MTRKLLILALAGVLTACMTPSHWRHPTNPREQWSKDEGACRRWASREAEGEYAQDLDIASDRGDAGYVRRGSVDTQMSVLEIKRRRDTLYVDCMKSRGYVPVD